MGEWTPDGQEPQRISVCHCTQRCNVNPSIHGRKVGRVRLALANGAGGGKIGNEGGRFLKVRARIEPNRRPDLLEKFHAAAQIVQPIVHVVKRDVNGKASLETFQTIGFS